MKFLELKIPPVLTFAICVALMWLTSLISNEAVMNTKFRLIIGMISLVTGGCIASAGVLEFKKVKTPLNPLKPDQAKSVVSTGIYKFTRNPMYLGLLFGLIFWTCYLDNLYCLIFVIFFPWYMTQFQIKPEERTLQSIFGEPYDAYKTRVRRWF